MRNTVLLLALLPALAAAQESAPPPLPEVVKSSKGDVRVTRMAGLEFPWGMAYLPDGRLLITEKPGRLRIWADGKLSAPVPGLPKISHRNDGDQGGLLDVAVDPAFATNGYVYLSFSEAADPQPAGAAETGDSRFGNYLDKTDTLVRGGAVARGRLVGNALQDVKVVWRQEPKTVGRGHFGNRLVFAPDGTLFITSGERMRFDPAQALDSTLGKTIRINPDGTIPADNPFAKKEGARGEIWSLGHRNMLSAAVHPGTGQLWVMEMGPLGGDELNVIEPGKNYGWPVVSNGDNYDSSVIPDHPARREFEPPLRSWTPVISPSGMVFYDGPLFPYWQGNLLAGGLSSMALVRLTLEGTRIADEERMDLKRRIRDVVQAPDGSLMLLVDAKDGALLRLTPDLPPAPSR